MMRLSVAIGILVISASTASFCQVKASGKDEPEYTHAQIGTLAHHARIVQEYTFIADYYGRPQQFYRRKTAEAMYLWADRYAIITPLCEKWPRPVDSARNLHDYYEYEVSRSAKLFAKDSALADVASAQ